MKIFEKVTKFPKMNKSHKVGLITNYLTEQYISMDLNTVSLQFINYLDLIKKHTIETVFIENYIYERDQYFFNNSYEELLKKLESLNVNIIVLVKENEKLQECLLDYPQVVISYDDTDNKANEQKIEVPLIVNEKNFNPVNSQKIYDIIYFTIGEIGHSDEFIEFHNKFKVKVKNISTEELNREFLKRFFKVIKDSKLIFIQYSSSITDDLMKYIEIIATLQNTITIIDPLFERKGKYSIKFDDNISSINYMRALLNNSMLVDKYIIPKTREVLLKHTGISNASLNNKLNSGFDYDNDFNADISVITSTKRKGNLKHLIKELNIQKNVNLQIVLLTHGYELTQEEIRSLTQLCNFELTIISRDSSMSFGNCLNECIKYVKHDYVLKVDDDDFYFPNFIIDIYLGMKYSGASIVGKNAFFFYLESENLVGQRRMTNQFKKVREVKGNTLLLETNELRKYSFGDLSRHVDSDLIIRLRENGGYIYSIHPYDMCVFRGKDKSDHTWQVNDSRFLRDADILYYGLPNETISTNK